jgi:hypothetical protein
MTEAWTHQGSKNKPARGQSSAGISAQFIGETQVTATTSPTFIYQTDADTTAPGENAVAYYLALRKAGVPAEFIFLGTDLTEHVSA